MIRRFAISLLCCLLALTLSAQRRKSKKDIEPKPQVLEVLPELPDAISGDSAHLAFQISPLSAKGLLSQQIRDALKALDQQRHGATIIKLRAFVAGSGDLRRVKDIVAEEFTERHLPLPVLTTVQVGALPMVGAQVVIESMALDRRPANPSGIVLFSAVPAPDTTAALREFSASVESAGLKPANILKITCFLGDLNGSGRADVIAAFPAASINLVQMQRLGIEPQAACEGVGRMESPPPTSISFSKRSAILNSPKMVFTGAQMVFRDQPADVSLAFQRLARTMQTLGVGYKNVVWAGAYALSLTDAKQLADLQWDFLDRNKPPSGTSLLFEGLPSGDATAAMEFIAVGN